MGAKSDIQEEVLIVGAGPTGLVLALQLAFYQIPFRIIDKKKKPNSSSRAMIVVPRILEQYQQMGIVNQIIEKGIKLEGASIWVEGNNKAEINLKNIGKNLSPFPFILLLPQNQHERILIEKLEQLNKTVEWQSECLNFTQSDAYVSVTIKTVNGEEKKKYAYVVGCDGASSRVRNQMGVSFIGGTYDELFYVLDAKLKQSHYKEKNLEFCFTKEELALFFPLKTPDTRRIIGIFPKELVRKNQIKYEYLRPFLEYNFSIDSVERIWFSTYKVHHRIAERFFDQRVFLLGDAAHIHSPVGGQGMNAGIGDAINLGWKLAAVVQKRAPHVLLETYQSERKKFAEKLVSSTDRLFEAAVSKKSLTRWSRNQLLPNLAEPLLNHSEYFRKQLFRVLSQIRIEYKDSLISEGKAGNIKAGIRLPYHPALKHYEKGRSWHIHIFGTAGESLVSLVDQYQIRLKEWNLDASQKQAGYLKDHMYLIRPDGYIAWIGRNQEEGSLKNFLEYWFKNE